MRRVCGMCRKTLGEKCRKCGSSHASVLSSDGPFSLWRCVDCHHTWRTGDDPETTGLCEECYDKAEAQLKLKKTA
jgi:NAD-dependent SIR2 family protein deacetylase